MLTTINTTVLCMKCERRVIKTILADMICVHIMGVWQFLRIGFGADDVKATLCIICPPCIERLSGGKIEDQDEEALVHNRSQERVDLMKELGRKSHVVVTCTFDQAKQYLKEGRPLIRVGWERISAILY